jgi:2-polyprenyl-3-methyl-5-hydroxy-6-metoxy-1,4-benzoquinol methylase
MTEHSERKGPGGILKSAGFFMPRRRLPDLAFRSEKPEWMDDLNAGTESIRKTYGHFKIINLLFSGIRFLTKRYILEDIYRRKLRKIRVVDIGAGGGDFAIWFWDYCHAHGLQAEIICLDYDERAIDYARQKTGNRRSIEFVQGDALRMREMNLKAHYITANHFLHHVSDEFIPSLLSQFYNAASCGILVNDILRTYKAYLSFTLLGKILFSGGFTHADGCISIERGFRRNELTDFVSKAGLSGSLHVGTAFPSRIFIHGVKSGAAIAG